MSRVLILSDGRVGHLQQSVAFAQHLELSYDIVEVSPRFVWSKVAALLCDRISCYLPWWFKHDPIPQAQYGYVVGAGSGTYYMVKHIAKKLGVKSVTMMLPKGYRYDYDLILAQSHDNPPELPLIKTLPVNLSYTQSEGIFKTEDTAAVGVIIGGENGLYRMTEGTMRVYLDEIVRRYGKSHTVAVTTSPRTPPAIEALVASYGFDYTVIYSQEKINPIPDFLAQCETVFITADSTSMISQTVSYGKSYVVVLPLERVKEGKHQCFVETLEQGEYLHLYDGSIKHRNRKIDLKRLLQKAVA